MKPTQRAGFTVRSAEHADDWFSPGRFALLLGGFIFASFPDVLLGLSTFHFRDFDNFAYPLASYHRETFWRGEIPLWNPLNNCGQPFLAQWNTLVLYPGSLFYLLLPLSWSLAVFCLLHQFIGGFGAYLLAHRWTGSRLAAAVAGTAFAFNGLTLNSLMWTNNSAALGWMPWVVLAASTAWRKGGRKIVTAVVVGTLQMLAGGPEIIAATWLVATLLLLIESRGSSAEFSRRVVRFVLAGVLVAGLSAAQLLPFLELMARSHRDQSFFDASWAMPGWGWANLLVPQFYSFTLFDGVKFQYDQGWTSSYYLGIGTLALALFAAWHVHNHRVWALASVSVLGLFLAIGDQGPLYRWSRHIFPPLAWVRFPVKFVLPLVFAVPLLAAFGISSSRVHNGTRWNGQTIRLVSLWAALLLLIIAVVWFAKLYPQYDPPYSDWPATLRSGVSRAVFLSAILGVVIVLRSVSQPVVARMLQIGLIVLVWLDVRTHTPDQNPRVDRAAYGPSISPMSPKPLPGVARAMISPNATAVLYNQGFSSNALTNYLFNRLALNGNLNLLEGIPKLDGFFSLELRHYSEVRRLLYATRRTELSSLMDFLAVSQVTKPDVLFGWRQRSSALPMITSGQRPVFADTATTLAALTNSTFDPRRVVYFPIEVEPNFQTRTPAPARIATQHTRAHRLDLLVEASGPSLVTVAQAYYPAWRARVDGRPAPVWRANHAFQAVELPAGNHTVVLSYVDGPFYLGGFLSLAVLLGCAAASACSKRAIRTCD